MMNESLENLKSALLQLSPTGENGFEGLIAVALKKITGIPFRLAKSGSQRGMDGKESEIKNCIYFECKLYSNSIPKNEIFSKVAELGIHNDETDLVWILAATVPVSVQDANDLQKIATKMGVIPLIFDWSTNQIPELAVVLAMAGSEIECFLKNNVEEESFILNALNSLSVIRNSNEYLGISQLIKSKLTYPSLAISCAINDNREWLFGTFSSKENARSIFGQTLSPYDKDAHLLPREYLVGQLKQSISNNSNSNLLVIHGNEGCGKSWIIAQAWYNLQKKPLFIIITAEQIKASDTENIENFIIEQIIKQTNSSLSVITIQQWHRRLNAWKTRATELDFEMIVVVDGINQKPDLNWGHFIDKLAIWLRVLNSALWITTRTTYYQTFVERRVATKTIKIEIPQWTDEERDLILARQGIESKTLHPSVSQSLLNPRILNIALTLFDNKQIASFNELSSTRILFEYIRLLEKDSSSSKSAQDFMEALQKYAQKMLQRYKQNELEDINIFEKDMAYVAEGQFFTLVKGEPTKYELTKNGSLFALGLAVVTYLLKAKRNKKDIYDALIAITEPVSALDDLAEVIISALTILCYEDQYYEEKIIPALIKSFATLQNIDKDKNFDSFCGLSLKCPEDFTQAAYDLSLEGKEPPSFDWVKNAMLYASSDSTAWIKIANEIKIWLACYSTSPDALLMHHMLFGNQEDAKKKLAEQEQKVNDKLTNLSLIEKKVLQQMKEVKGDVNALSKLALFILAGKKLSSFSESLFYLSFRLSLNDDFNAPYKEFTDLITFNIVDWENSCKGLYSIASQFEKNEISSVGQWTLVRIYSSTGDPNTYPKASSLACQLRGNSLRSWRLIESYCAADPCNPASTKPKNIEKTLKNYDQIDVAQLYETFSQTHENMFFEDTLYGIARFHIDAAIKKFHELIDHVLQRRGLPLRQGILSLRKHRVLFSKDQVQAFIQCWRDDFRTGELKSYSENDTWIVRNYFLLLTFPHLSTEERVNILLSKEYTDHSIMLDAVEGMEPLTPNILDDFLSKIFEPGNKFNTGKKYNLLEIILSTNTQLTPFSKKIILKLILSDDTRLRTLAYAITAQSKELILLKAVSDKSQSFRVEIIDNKQERWYGSLCTLYAAFYNLIDESDALLRISHEVYGEAISVLSIDGIKEIARRMEVSICKLLSYHAPYIEANIELTMNGNGKAPLFSLKERESDKGSWEKLKELGKEKNAQDRILAFEKDQEKMNKEFDNLYDDLSRQQLEIVVTYFSLENFKKLIDSAPEYTENLLKIFSNLSDEQISYFYNLIVLLAYCLSFYNPDKSIALWEKLENKAAHIKMSYGIEGIDLKNSTIWSAEDNEIINAYRFKLLDRTKNDSEIFYTVLAASFSQKECLLKKYIQDKIEKIEPSNIARGIMVAGFMNKNDFSESVFFTFKHKTGFIGDVHKAAQYAYERNVWSHHWYEKMCSTNDRYEFWQAQVLLSKIVDGRYGLWHHNYKQTGKVIQQFGGISRNALKDRYRKWNSKRKKKLFGQDIPNAIFLL